MGSRAPLHAPMGRFGLSSSSQQGIQRHYRFSVLLATLATGDSICNGKPKLSYAEDSLSSAITIFTKATVCYRRPAPSNDVSPRREVRRRTVAAPSTLTNRRAK